MIISGTVTVDKKPTLVTGLEGVRITNVACGSSHSIAWSTTDAAVPCMHLRENTSDILTTIFLTPQ